jgi:hypothetical protein
MRDADVWVKLSKARSQGEDWTGRGQDKPGSRRRTRNFLALGEIRVEVAVGYGWI